MKKIICGQSGDKIEIITRQQVDKGGEISKRHGSAFEVLRSEFPSSNNLLKSNQKCSS